MQVYTTITVDEPAPGLKTIVSFVIPNQKSGKVELQYLHEYAGINTGIGLTGNFTKCNTGLSFCTADLIASLALNDQGDTVSASYCHTVKPVTNTAVDAELTHSFSGNENTLTIGITAFVGPIDHGEGSR